MFIGFRLPPWFFFWIFAAGFMTGGFFFDNVFHLKHCPCLEALPLVLHPQAPPR